MSNRTISVTSDVGQHVQTESSIEVAATLTPFILGLVAGTIGAMTGVGVLVVTYFFG